MRPGAHAAARDVARHQGEHSRCVQRSERQPQEPASEMDERSAPSSSSETTATHETALRLPPLRM
eukprot:10879597-Heterocapsa_arctica.AAC.1